MKNSTQKRHIIELLCAWKQSQHKGDLYMLCTPLVILFLFFSVEMLSRT